MIGRQGQQVAIAADGLGEQPLFPVGFSQVQMGFEEIRLQFDGPLATWGGFRKSALLS